MKNGIFPLLVGFCAAFVATTLCQANLYVYDYDPGRHDRFYSGADGDFVGEGFDFSGVGHTSSYRWVTMISPTYFLTATHFLPPAGSTVTFYEGNIKSPAFRHDYVVDDYFVTFTWNGLPSDLTLGRLVVPENRTEAILPEDNIAYYPIISPSEFTYTGADVFVYGKTGIVGTNEIARTYPFLDESTASYDKHTYIARYFYNAGPDEAFVVSGDSGAPSFIVWEGQLALAGTHYLAWGAPPPTSGVSSFGDSFVPEYIEQILAVQIEGDLDGNHRVDSRDIDSVRANWGREVTPGDLTQGDASGDGFVGSPDLDIVRSNWNRTGPGYYLSRTAASAAAVAVPEPSCLFLAVGAAVTAVFRARNRRPPRARTQGGVRDSKTG